MPHQPPEHRQSVHRHSLEQPRLLIQSAGGDVRSCLAHRRRPAPPGSGRAGQQVNTESLQADTWTWRSGQWVLQHPSTSPPALYGTTMPDSPVAGDLSVVAGGFTGADTLSGATYSWTGSTWVKNS